MRILAAIHSILILAILFAGSLRAQQPQTNIKTPAPGVKDPNVKDPPKEPIKKPLVPGEKLPPEKFLGGKPIKPGIDPFAFTPEREAAAMTFVKQHHPELAELVSVLKESRPKEYQKAVRDLYRASEHLANFRESDAQRYQLELKAWRIDSRVQLLVARVRMQPTDEKLTAELRAELSQRVDVRLEMLKLERERLAEKASRLDAQIGKLEQGRESQVDRQLSEFLSKGRPSKNVKPANKPVVKPEKVVSP